MPKPTPGLVRSVPDCSHGLEELLEVIRETARWCAFKADPDAPASSLRSEELRPGLIPLRHGATRALPEEVRAEKGRGHVARHQGIQRLQ